MRDVRENLFTDLLHILLAGIALGDDDKVCVGIGDLSCFLSAVKGLAADTAEHEADLALRIMVMYIVEQRFIAHLVMCAVHDHVHIAIECIGFHASGDLDMRKTLADCFDRNAKLSADRDRRQCVAAVVAAADIDAKGFFSAVQHRLDHDVARSFFDRKPLHLRSAVKTESHSLFTACLCCRQHPRQIGLVHVQIHAGDPAAVKDFQLGCKVILHIAVLRLRDMILRNIQKSADLIV